LTFRAMDGVLGTGQSLAPIDIPLRIYGRLR
jgi:hypothetical protein